MRMSSYMVAGGAATLVAIFLFSARAQADGSTGPVYYPNGDVATATAECDPGCATISQSNGDQIKVLVGDSGHCNSYVMTFMRMTNNQVVAVWASSTDRNPDTQGMMGGARCGGFRNTHQTIDGAIDMGIFQNTDGKVFVLFFGGSTTPPPVAQPSAAPSASASPAP